MSVWVKCAALANRQSGLIGAGGRIRVGTGLDGGPFTLRAGVADVERSTNLMAATSVEARLAGD